MDEDDDIMIIGCSIATQNESQKKEREIQNQETHFTDVHNTQMDTLSQLMREGNLSSGCDLQAMKTWIYPTNYPMRDYQFNIVKAALFQNTLVCLPTGLGKTFIAAVLMYNYYRWFPTSKIIFMAPTRPLVSQQIEACFNIMGIPQEHTAQMTGMTAPDKRAQSWVEHRILFLTPHVLVNDLSRGLCPMKSIKLVVVDEAHKALGDYAYCQVIKQLKQQNYEFRVVALSATPGSDILAVQQVISNLLISHIEMRSEDSLDIREYTHHRSLEKIVVKVEGELEDTKNKFFQIIKPYVQRLLDHKVLFTRDEESLTKFQILKSRESFRQNPPMNMPHHIKGILEGSFALCMTLYHASELLVMHGIRSFYNFLKGTLESKSHSSSRGELLRNRLLMELLDSLAKQYDNPLDAKSEENGCGKGSTVGSHPKIEKLKVIVVQHFEQFKLRNLSTRVMIFSQYRDSVTEITEQLTYCGSLVKPMSFIGQSSAVKGIKGFSQNEQLRVVKQFKEGDFNTLISTCVGEEGLDIGDVDLIICYDVLKSPIRLVQRMGRTGRKREGRIVVLITEGREEQMYMQSHFKKKSINNALTNGNKLARYLYANNPRMVPHDLNPVCMKMMMTIREWKSSTLKGKKSGTPRKNIASYFDQKATGSKVPLKKNGRFLNSEEEAWYLHNLKVDETEKNELKLIPLGKMKSISLKNGLDEDSDCGESRLVDLGEYQPWQTTLQPCTKLSHSLQSHHLVELTEFINLQVCLGSDNDNYGVELAPFLDLNYFEASPIENIYDEDSRSCPSSKISKKGHKRAKTLKKSLDISSFMKKRSRAKKVVRDSEDIENAHLSCLAKDNVGDKADDDIEVLDCITSGSFANTSDKNKEKDSGDSKFDRSLFSPSYYRNLNDIFNYITPQKDSFLYIKQPPAESPSKDVPFISHRSLILFMQDFNNKLKSRWKLKFERLFYVSSVNRDARDLTNSIDLNHAECNDKQAGITSEFAIVGNSLSDIARNSVKRVSYGSLDEAKLSEPLQLSRHWDKASNMFIKKPFTCEDNVGNNQNLGLANNTDSIYKEDLQSLQEISPMGARLHSEESQLEIRVKHQRNIPLNEGLDFEEVSPIIKRKPSSQLCTSTPVPHNARKLFSRVEVTPLRKDDILRSHSSQADLLPKYHKAVHPTNILHPETNDYIDNSEEISVNVNFNLSCVDLFADIDANDIDNEANASSKNANNLHQSSTIEPPKHTEQDKKMSVKSDLSASLLTETQMLDFLDQPSLIPAKSLSRPISDLKIASTLKNLSTHSKESLAIKSKPSQSISNTSQPEISNFFVTHKSRVHRSLSKEFSGNSPRNNANGFKVELSEHQSINTTEKDKTLDQGWIDCSLQFKSAKSFNNSPTKKLNISLNKSNTKSNPNKVSFDIGLIDFGDWTDDAIQPKESFSKYNLNLCKNSEIASGNAKSLLLNSSKLDPYQEEESTLHQISRENVISVPKDADSLQMENYNRREANPLKGLRSDLLSAKDIEETKHSSVRTLNDTHSPIAFKRKLKGILILSDDDDAYSNINRTSPKKRSDVKIKRKRAKHTSSPSISGDDFVASCNNDNKNDDAHQTKVSNKKQLKRKIKKKIAFIDLEADVSFANGDEVSSDESEEDLDCLDESFVDDLTQPTQQECDMKAVYLQSVRSPPTKRVIVGKSGAPDKSSSSEKSEWSFQGEPEDSFVVGNDCVEYETEHFGDSFLAEDPIINEVLIERGKKGKCASRNKRRRIILSEDSNTEDEIESESKVPKMETENDNMAEGVNFDFGLDLMISDENDLMNGKGLPNSKSPVCGHSLMKPHAKVAPFQSIGERNNIISANSKNCLSSNPALSVISTNLGSSEEYFSCKQSSRHNKREVLYNKGISADFNTNEILIDSPHSSKDSAYSKSSKEEPNLPKSNVRPLSSLNFTHNEGKIINCSSTGVKISESRIPFVSHKKQQKKFSTGSNITFSATRNSNLGDDDIDFKEDNRLSMKRFPTKSQNSASANTTFSNETHNTSLCSNAIDSFASSQSNMSSLLHKPKPQGELCILVDSNELSIAGLIISKLRMVHEFKTLVTQLMPASYVLSSRMAVFRQSYSNFVNSSNRASLVERLQGLLRLYERPVVIVEADNGLSVKSMQRTLYVDTIACACSQLPQLKILQAANKEETTHIIQKLIHSERLKGHAIPPIQEENRVVKFYRKFPKVNCASAIFLSKNFFTIYDFLNSSAEELMGKGRLTRSQAAAVLSHIKRNFRKDMLPPSLNKSNK